MSLRNKNKNATALAMVFLILGIIAGFVIENIKPEQLLIGIMGGIIAIIFFVGAEYLASRNENAEIQEKLDKILGSTGIVHMGMPDKAVEHVFRLLQDENDPVLCVYDSFLRVEGNASFRAEDYSRKFLDVIAKMLKRSGARYFSISNPIAMQNSIHELAMKEFKANYNFHVKIVHCNIPVVNFLVIEFFGNRETEVYFGWDFSKKPAPVFMTKDTKVVEYFKSLFSAIETVAEKPPFY